MCSGKFALSGIKGDSTVSGSHGIGRVVGLSKPIGESRRADSNRLPLLQLRVITQALQGFAGDCKYRIFRGVSFLRLAECCTVLRSRWYQSGIKRSDSYSLTAGLMTRTPELRSQIPYSHVRRCSQGLSSNVVKIAIRATGLRSLRPSNALACLNSMYSTQADAFLKILNRLEARWRSKSSVFADAGAYLVR